MGAIKGLVHTIVIAAGFTGCALIYDFDGFSHDGAGGGASSGSSSSTSSPGTGGGPDAGPPSFAIRLSGMGDDLVRGMDVDSKGNVAVAIIFHGTIDVAGTAYGPLPPGDQGLLVAKFDPAGKPLWSKWLGASTDTHGFSCSLRVDPGDNILLSGAFDEWIDVGAGEVKSMGFSDFFLAAISPDGQPLPPSRVIGTAADEGAASIAAGPGGHIAITGSYNGGLFSFGSPCEISKATMDYNMFVAEFDASWNCLWIKNIGDMNPQVGMSTAVDEKGSVAVTGFITGTATFGIHSVSAPTPAGALALARYDVKGVDQFALLISVPGGGRIVFDAQGNTLVGGNAAGSFFFDPSTPYAGGADAMIAMFDPTGAPKLHRLFGDSSDQSLALVVDPRGGLVAGGYVAGSMALDAFVLTSHGMADAFIAELDDTGKVVSAKQFGDAEDQGIDIIRVDPFGRRVVAGHFRGSIDLGPGLLKSNGGYDVFVAALAPE